MPTDERYRRQVSLLVQILPLVAEERCFALKGGTAINLFIRDLPRLSVDIDLTYLPIADREASLREVDTAMRRIAERVKNALRGAQVHLHQLKDADVVDRLHIHHRRARVKIEVNPVLRGCVHDPQERAVSNIVQEQFGYAEVQVVSFPDLYAGKLLAALDRQHPRDFFDVHGLLRNEGIDDRLRDAFVIYLVSHNASITALLDPDRRDLSVDFARELAGMTEEPVELDVLNVTRENLIVEIVDHMPDAHKHFLLSFYQGDPNWTLLRIPHVEALPAVRHRMRNLDRMTAESRARLLSDLEAALE